MTTLKSMETKEYSTITLTFGEQAENHRGMQIIGDGLATEGFSCKELRVARNNFREKGFECQYIRLDKLVRDHVDIKLDRASILIVRNGVEALINSSSTAADDLLKEQVELKWDTKAKMYGRVVNKHARYNLCYGNESQQANYQEGKGTVVHWNDIPLTKQIKLNLPLFLGQKAENIHGEGNLYYDSRKCGIGYHGDTERRLVMAVRLGYTMPLYYQWFYQGTRIGPRLKMQLNHGDLYVMSDKSTGHDWKRKNIATLRHAAGCDKYTK